MRVPLLIASVILLLTVNTAFALNPVSWSLDETIDRNAGSQFWTSPTAIDLGLVNYEYSYEITKVEATVRPFLVDVTVDVTDDIAGSFDLIGSGSSPALPAELLNAALNDAGTGTSANILIEVDNAGFGQAAFTNIMLGQAEVPVFGMVDIQSIRVQATIMLSGMVPSPGDFNHDGFVNLTDYDQWADDFGKINPAGEASDANGDNIVNAADYTIWRDAYEAQQSATTASIPEPVSLLLAMSAATPLLILRRRN